MPQITLLGWFHTIVGGLSIVLALIALYRYKRLSIEHTITRVFLAGTVFTAATALAIYQHGFFTPAHALAVLTLLAVAAGIIAEQTTVLRSLGRYVAAISYLATLLFHLIPAVTDATLRLPVSDPMLSSIEDPRLKMAYLVLLILYVIAAILQIRWLYKHPEVGTD